MQRTHLAFQHDGHLSTLDTKVLSIQPLSSLSENDRSLFKAPDETDNSQIFAVITSATVFHPQGGGQPSDEGFMTSSSSGSVEFSVSLVRTTPSGSVLHFGFFTTPNTTFQPSETITQKINIEKRILYSRYHTAGHVLGASVRKLLEAKIDGFDELKASHFPDSAACEFAGSIPGTAKSNIQTQLEEYISQNLTVQIDWWDESDFEREGLQRLIPDREAMGLEVGEKFRVVRILGAETYPCGGTHVDGTGECKGTRVKKISRSKGTSRVGYLIN